MCYKMELLSHVNSVLESETVYMNLLKQQFNYIKILKSQVHTQENVSIWPHKNMYTNVHSIIHNSPKQETTQMSTS